ncbi:MAG: hypothetical protein PHI97_00505 [Desulfobulbus sp.]|jgi:hypothetical protein|nr:hypothetical protein [Desulfobulbus sp.]
MENVIDKYKPKVNGKSDFFSWNLYIWLKKNPEYCRIYKGVWNSANGYDPSRPTLYIGFVADNWFHGTMLRRVCNLGLKEHTWAYGPRDSHLDEWIDITDEFFADYERRGVCAIHDDMVHVWEKSSPDERRCVYCGKTETRAIIFAPQEVWS